MAQEKTFENKIKKFIDKQGGYEVKFFANAFTKTGVPDVLACVNGKFIGIEVKASNGKPSALQIHNLKEIDSAGGYAILLYPENYSTFKDMVCFLEEGEEFDARCKYLELKEVWLEWEKKLEN